MCRHRFNADRPISGCFMFNVVVLLFQWLNAVMGQYGGPSSTCSNDPNCFQQSTNCAVSIAAPFDRRTPFTCAECLNLCRKTLADPEPYRCRTAVYDNNAQSCDIFAISGGTKYPFVRYPGRDVFMTKPSCTGTPSPGSTPAPSTDSICPSGTLTRYVSVPDQVLSGNDDLTFSGSLAQCTQACTQNKAPDGRSISCKSFDFSGSNCILSKNAAQPTGSGTLEKRAGSGYFEKVCISTQLANRCGSEIFERRPLQILVGFANSATKTNTFSECLNACLDSQTRFGFRCLSGQFFYGPNEAQDNCVLNIETKNTQPGLFTQTTEQTDYFQLSCQGGQAVLRDGAQVGFIERQAMMRKIAQNKEAKALLGSWTSWGDCNVSVDKRHRYQRCVEPDVRKCPKNETKCDRHELNENVPEWAKQFQDGENVVAAIDGPTPPPRISGLERIHLASPELGVCRCLFNAKTARRLCNVGVMLVKDENGQIQREKCTTPT